MMRDDPFDDAADDAAFEAIINASTPPQVSMDPDRLAAEELLASVYDVLDGKVPERPEEPCI
jgi:hypothetical protein